MKRIGSIVLLMTFTISLATAQVRHDLFLRMNDGDSLDATYFVPSKPPPINGYPAVISVHGFGDSKESAIQTCLYYSDQGYVTLAFSVRGQGNSSGLSTIMSLREREDLASVVSFVRHLPFIDTSAVGLGGGSQGGLHGLWAASDHLPLTTIVSGYIVPDWASDLLSNGCYRWTFPALMRNGSVRYAPIRDTLWYLLRDDMYDSLKDLFTRYRDIDTSTLNASSIPLYQMNVWQDNYFTPKNGIFEFLKYRTLKRLYIGTRGHYSDNSTPELTFMYTHERTWLRQFLSHINTGILNEPMIGYAYSSLPMDSLGYFTWTHATSSTWPPAGVKPVRFYLGPDSSLLTSPPVSRPDSIILANEYNIPSYNLDSAYAQNYRGARFDAALPKHTFAFLSLPLASDIYWLGLPTMKLYLSSNFPKFPIHVQLYEVDRIGAKHFINRINYTARGWRTQGTQSIEVAGNPHAHKFSRGNRIRIEITNIDKTNRLLLGPVPFVIPLFFNTSVTVFFDARRPSYVELPISQDVSSVGVGQRSN